MIGKFSESELKRQFFVQFLNFLLSESTETVFN